MSLNMCSAVRYMFSAGFAFHLLYLRVEEIVLFEINFTIESDFVAKVFFAQERFNKRLKKDCIT